MHHLAPPLQGNSSTYNCLDHYHVVQHHVCMVVWQLKAAQCGLRLQKDSNYLTTVM
jgi:hypothetical protein